MVYERDLCALVFFYVMLGTDFVLCMYVIRRLCELAFSTVLLWIFSLTGVKRGLFHSTVVCIFFLYFFLHHSELECLIIWNSTCSNMLDLVF